MKKLMMFLSILGMVSVGSVYADGGTGAKEDANCLAIDGGDRGANEKVSPTPKDDSKETSATKQ